MPETPRSEVEIGTRALEPGQGLHALGNLHIYPGPLSESPERREERSLGSNSSSEGARSLVRWKAVGMVPWQVRHRQSPSYDLLPLRLGTDSLVGGYGHWG